MNKLDFWMRFSVINFAVVALLGVLMRYKIAFSLPMLDQKHLQEAHSHFAFYGWVTQVIYVLVLRYLVKNNATADLQKYKVLLWINLAASYLMVVSFVYGGYFWLSIAASTAALLVSFVMLYYLSRDFKAVTEFSKHWFMAGLWFAALSSIGVFTLSFMTATDQLSQTLYLASTYYFLHFQYNGFFIFSCIGLLVSRLNHYGAGLPIEKHRMIFILMVLGCIIGFGLSVLWMNLPLWLLLIITVGTIAQTVASFILFQSIIAQWNLITKRISKTQQLVWIYVGFAFAVKILLQLGSNIPQVSEFAFGFRNVVIAYLHLVLLMCISIYLLNEILATNRFGFSKSMCNGLYIVLVGIVLNEAVLGLMGVLSIKYIALPNSQYMLFAISVLILLGLLLMVYAMYKTEKKPQTTAASQNT